MNIYRSTEIWLTKKMKRFGFGEYIVIFIGLILLVGVILKIIAIAYSNGIYFIGYPMDGTFCIFYPLKRLMTGQIPGHDFNYFQGLGVMYLHYPIFLLFGKNLFAAEFSRYLVSPSLFLIGNLFVLYAFTKKLSWSVLFTAISAILPLQLIYQIFLPVNSMLGVRAFMPMVVGTYVVCTGNIGSRKVWVIVPLLIALSVFCGVDQGFPLLLSWIAILLIFGRNYWNTLFRRIKVIFLSVILFFGELVGLHVLASGKYFWEPIKYTLFEIPVEQFWATGSPPSKYFRNIGEILSDVQLMIPVLVGLVMLFFVWIMIKKSVRKNNHVIGIVFLLLYGLFIYAEQLAYVDNGHTLPLVRIEILLVFIGIIYLLQKGERLFGEKVIKKIPRNFIRILGVLIVGVLVFLEIPQYGNSLELLGRKYTGKQYLGSYLPSSWQDHTETVLRLMDGKKGQIWSTYSTIPEAILGQFNPSSDVILWKLGPTGRAQYVEKFKESKPEMVTTVRRSFSVFEEWFQIGRWDFYEEIIRNYRAKTSTNWAVIWEKLPDARWEKNLAWDGKVTIDDNNRIMLPKIDSSSPVQVITVKVRYKIENPWIYFPYIKFFPRYFIVPEGSLYSLPVSLPPYKNEFEFPLVITQGSTPILKKDIGSLLPGVNFKIESLEYRLEKISKENIEYLTELYW